MDNTKNLFYNHSSKDRGDSTFQEKRRSEAYEKTIPKTLPKIIAASVRYKGVTYTGDRHCNILRYMIKLQIPELSPLSMDLQGFIDQTGQHLSRSDALERCIKTGQVKLKDGKPDLLGGPLTSEDLW